jgi:RHS repeat-associated protein
MPRAGQNNWVYLFQGMRYYAAAGFYGSQSSVYYPKLGRWEQNEPSDLDGGDVNTYRFEGNNPVSQIVSGDTGSLWSDYIAPAIVSTNWLFGNVSTGWLAQVSNFSAGAGDTVSIGLTQRFRTAVGYNDVVNSNSLAYGIGQVAGTGVNIGLGFANPCGAAGAAIRGINALQAFGGAVNYADNMMQGNYGTAALDALGVLGNLSQLSRSCFSGDTELMARGDWGQGWRRIDKIMEDDEVLSRPEGDPNGVVEWKHVEELFRRFGFMIHLHTDGQVIRTTMEHPFYVLDKGWVTAAELKTGDLLSSHDGQWVAVEEVYDTGDYEAVYNLRVADFHTYFVGGEDWGFSV